MKPRIIFVLFAVLLLMTSSCKTLDINKFYTQENRNVIPNIETKLEYTLENLFYLNAFANLKLFYKRAKQDLISDAQLIYYNELNKFHERSGAPSGQLQVKVKSINLVSSAVWATVVSGITFCTVNLFGFPLLGYKCTANIEMLVLDQKQTLIGTYPGTGSGKSFAGLYFSYNPTDAQKKVHLESFKNALTDALARIEADKIQISEKLKSTGKIPDVIKPSNTITQDNNFARICDVDSLPETINPKNINRFALIFGNEDYKKYQDDLSSESNVDFARHDALTFAEYCHVLLGVPDENIVIVTDAISTQMKREIEKISKLAKYANGEAEIIFYYAGHGYPDETSKEPYLIPCDISASQIKDGINLNWLYKKLTENNIKKASVFLDACFTGGARNKGLISTRGVKIIPKQAEIPENLIVMAASGNDQAAYPFNEKQHGLFTYFLLKKILESKGKISYKELFESVYSNVGKNAVRKFNSDQEPTLIFGKTAEAFIENLKLVD